WVWIKAEAVGLEPTSGSFGPPPVFKTGPSSSRMTSTTTRSGGWNRTNGLLVQSQASLPAATAPDRFPPETTRTTFQFGEKDSNLHPLVQSQAAYRLADPRVLLPFRVPCGSRPRLASLEGWHLCRSAKGTSSPFRRIVPIQFSSGRRGSRTLKA